MVISPPDYKPSLIPNDLSADHEAGGFEAFVNLAGMQRRVPNIGNVPGEQRPSLSPIGLVVVKDLAYG
jgi:hypothetical protein